MEQEDVWKLSSHDERKNESYTAQILINQKLELLTLWD